MPYYLLSNSLKLYILNILGLDKKLLKLPIQIEFTIEN